MEPLSPQAPQRRRDAELKHRFIECLGCSRNVGAAARACALSRVGVYKLRWRDAEFAEAWDGVLIAGLSELDAKLDRRLAELDRAPAGSREARFAELLRQVRNGDRDEKFFPRTP